MYKDGRYINAGTNEFYRYGKKAQERISKFLEPNKNGFYAVPADGGVWWTIGTSTGKFGEFAKFRETIFSVNKAGYVWAKEGTPKGDVFIEMISQLIKEMNRAKREHYEFCTRKLNDNESDEEE